MCVCVLCVLVFVFDLCVCFFVVAVVCFLCFFFLFTQRFKSPYTGKMCTDSLRKTSVDAACVCQANSEAVSVSLYLCGYSVQPSFLPRHIYIYNKNRKNLKSIHIYGAYCNESPLLEAFLYFCSRLPMDESDALPRLPPPPPPPPPFIKKQYVSRDWPRTYRFQRTREHGPHIPQVRCY